VLFHGLPPKKKDTDNLAALTLARLQSSQADLADAVAEIE
jgi:hypothetical protein